MGNGVAVNGLFHQYQGSLIQCSKYLSFKNIILFFNSITDVIIRGNNLTLLFICILNTHSKNYNVFVNYLLLFVNCVYNVEYLNYFIDIKYILNIWRNMNEIVVKNDLNW